MTDPLTPPPWRTIPPEVKDRILATVEPEAKPKALIALAAAVVAVLAVGAVIIAQSIYGSPQDAARPAPATTTSWGPPLNPAVANAELNRCYAAVQASGKYPDRSQWRPVYNTTFWDITVIVAKAGNKPLFCQTTHTEVTVSDPDPVYLPGTRTGLAMVSSLGIAAGVLDPSWPRPWIKSNGFVGSAPLEANDGMFVTNNGFNEPLEVTKGPNMGDNPWIALPKPHPPTTTVDRPANPAPDRTSERGRALNDCLAEVKGVSDVASWQPGAVVQAGENRMMVTRNDYGYSICWHLAGTTGFGQFNGFNTYLATPVKGLAPQHIFNQGTMNSQVLVTGGVASQVTRVQIMVANGPIVDADVYNGTFAALLPASLGNRPELLQLTFRLYDAAGNQIYEGPWGAY